MNPHPLRGPARKIATVFGIILAVYCLVFVLDGFLRKRKGPWKVSFEKAQPGEVTIRISHEKLNIHDSQIRIQASPKTLASFTNATVDFRSPADLPPVGQVLYTDLTFLPGVVTLEIEGQDIELLPRSLVVNRTARGWNFSTPILLTPKDRLPEGPAAPQRHKQLGRELPNHDR